MGAFHIVAGAQGYPPVDISIGLCPSPIETQHQDDNLKCAQQMAANTQIIYFQTFTFFHLPRLKSQSVNIPTAVSAMKMAQKTPRCPISRILAI